MDENIGDPWRLAEALSGSSDAWNSIVDEFAGSVWSWARSQGLTREEAEDVSQTVWYRLKDKGHTIRDPRTLPGWLATTTRREAIRVSKRRDKTIDTTILETVPEPTHASNDPAKIAEANDLHEKLADAFAELRSLCRELLSLCWDERYSYADIAEVLGRSVGSIGPTRQRCLDDLRARVGI